MKRLILAPLLWGLLASPATAGWPLHRRDPQAPPRWAVPGLQSPAALTPPAEGRRPWAYSLAQSDTPSAKMARYSQLGGGVGPMPGASNGPGWYPDLLPGIPWAPNPVRHGW